MLFFYQFLFSQISNKFPKLFEGGGTSKNKYNVWIFTVAESNLAGDIEKVQKISIWKLCEILNYLVIKRDAEREQYKKQNKKKK